MPHLEVVEEEVKSTCNKEEEKKNEIEEVEVKSNEVERQYEVEEVIDKRKSRFGKKGGKRKGVDYKVKWKEAYPGEYGKDNITWVRDIDLDAEEALEKYAEKRNKDYTEIERQEHKEERQEEQIENNEEETKEEKEDEIHKSEQEIEEQIQAFLTGVGDEKLTDRTIKQRDDYHKFVEGQEEELEGAFETGTFVRVDKMDIPRGANIFNMMWVYKIKPATSLEAERYRSRLCVLGNKQKKDSYSETFAAVCKVKMFRMLLAISVHLGLRMTQIDISNAFMYADLDREMYVYPPPGYEDLGILKLNKSLYGLKQAPRLWYDTIRDVLVKDLDFQQMTSDVCCFTHKSKRCYVLLYVDDICISTDDEELRKEIIQGLQKKFRLRQFDKAGVYVGLEMDWSADGSKVKVHQKTYIEKLLQIFRMDDSEPCELPAVDSEHLSRKDPISEKMKTRPYRSLVGSLLYTLGSRPDAAASIRAVSQFMQDPADSHWKAAKRILRYFKGTKEKGVVYEREPNFEVHAYCDSDWASGVDDRKSVTGYVVYAQGGPIIWKSKKQPTVARSSCEAEYVALADTISEALWVKMALEELKIVRKEPIKIYIDNQAAKNMAENPINHERTKHIDIQYHFIRQVVGSGVVQLYYVNTKNNISDLLTKSVKRSVFQKLVGELVR